MAKFYKADDTSNFVIALTDNAAVPTGYSLVEANSVDAAVEKHVPSIDLQRDGHIIHVTVGEVEHPMLENHYIEWIELVECDKVQRKHLKPGEKPEAVFYTDCKNVYAREYCNLHGHWRSK